MIKVMVVDDSPVILGFLVHVLEEDPAIQVVGTARNGREVIAALLKCRPDIISMDFHMPTMNGIETTRNIMETCPIPIVIVSGSIEPSEVSNSLKCLEAGALAIIQQPKGVDHPAYESTSKEYRETLKTLSEVRVVKRWPKTATKPAQARVSRAEPSKKKRHIEVVAIGASTGGPTVIETILSSLSRDFRPSILIVQHIAKGFINGFRDWLSQSSNISVRIAVQGELLLSSHAYLPPDGFYLAVDHQKRILLKLFPVKDGVTTSVDVLFRSVAEVFGPNAIGVLLSGMGRDGAEELKTMKEKGAVTIIQNEQTCVVFGMPGEAAKLDAVTYTLPPEGIAECLRNLVIEPKRMREWERNEPSRTT